MIPSVAQDMVPEDEPRTPIRERMGTMSPNRYVMIEREGGLVKIYTTNALGAKDRHNSILLEEAEAKGVASIIRQHFPTDDPRKKYSLRVILLAWVCGGISLALLYLLLAV